MIAILMCCPGGKRPYVTWVARLLRFPKERSARPFTRDRDCAGCSVTIVAGFSEVDEMFERHLRSVEHAAPVTTKYREFEHAVAELLNVPESDIYTSHIAKAGNFDVRMTQSVRARDARLRIGLVPLTVVTEGDLPYVKEAAVRIARDRYPGTSVLLVCDGLDGWRPTWAVGPAESEASIRDFSRFSERLSEFDFYGYPHASPTARAGLTVRLTEREEELIRVILARPEMTKVLYGLEPSLFARLIESDVSARDVIALAHRREVVDRFRRLLQDPDFFSDAVEALGAKEAVWQNLLEENPWILGISLAGQLLTSWNEGKLEQVVAGFSISGPGKRSDALMRTNGGIRAMVFAEIKHHETHLIDKQYRPGCWAPSPELTGGVVQVQRTVQLAIRQIGERLPEEDETGVETGEYTYLVRPRQFLIIGNLADLRTEHGIHRAKYESFELFRRSVHEPEILTFDELLARAEWHVSAADREVQSLPQCVATKALFVKSDLDSADRISSPTFPQEGYTAKGSEFVHRYALGASRDTPSRCARGSWCG
jgi:hypothetical protein